MINDPNARILHEKFGLTEEELNNLIKNVENYPILVSIRFRDLRVLLDELSEIVAVESINPWLHKENSAFGDLMPLKFIELMGLNRVSQMVWDFQS